MGRPVLLGSPAASLRRSSQTEKGVGWVLSSSAKERAAERRKRRRRIPDFGNRISDRGLRISD
jgi:hypothetical protein